MMALYDNGTGQFRGAGWWGSAVSLTGVIRDAAVTGMGSYDCAISTTYEKNVNAGRGQFRNEFSDDTGWWAMAWIDAYHRYRSRAQHGGTGSGTRESSARTGWSWTASTAPAAPR
ncbi:hypothetical protein [Amycolatopsis benzoatilytica]|uniref:hypothetical protein n=1 Tax=Amycolatopsis benzoatilytica TaxID=346045 RepID=UPI0003679D50|nr:hypothetical protein [Amycolatopsis benzoatilytica]